MSDKKNEHDEEVNTVYVWFIFIIMFKLTSVSIHSNSNSVNRLLIHLLCVSFFFLQLFRVEVLFNGRKHYVLRRNSEFQTLHRKVCTCNTPLLLYYYWMMLSYEMCMCTYILCFSTYFCNIKLDSIHAAVGLNSQGSFTLSIYFSIYCVLIKIRII